MKKLLFLTAAFIAVSLLCSILYSTRIVTLGNFLSTSFTPVEADVLISRLLDTATISPGCLRK